MAKAKRIFCVVAYDVQDDKLRGKVVKTLEKYGARVNLSVFECMFTTAQFFKVKESIGKQINSKSDTVIYYPVCVECFSKIVYQPERKLKIESVVVV